MPSVFQVNSGKVSQFQSLKVDDWSGDSSIYARHFLLYLYKKACHVLNYVRMAGNNVLQVMISLVER